MHIQNEPQKHKFIVFVIREFSFMFPNGMFTASISIETQMHSDKDTENMSSLSVDNNELIFSFGNILSFLSVVTQW